MRGVSLDLKMSSNSASVISFGRAFHLPFFVHRLKAINQGHRLDLSPHSLLEFGSDCSAASARAVC